MCPEVTAYIILPFGSRSETLRAARRLRELLPPTFGAQPTQALIDRDSAEGTTQEEGVHLLSVAMIENLLLSPEAIWEFLKPQKERVGMTSTNDVKNKLIEIAHTLRDDEIRLRIERCLKFRRIQPTGATLNDVRQSIDKEAKKMMDGLPTPADFDTIVEEAHKTVKDIITNNKELELFRGKEILRLFHVKYVHQTGIGLSSFCLQVARIIGRDPRLCAVVSAKLPFLAQNRET